MAALNRVEILSQQELLVRDVQGKLIGWKVNIKKALNYLDIVVGALFVIASATHYGLIPATSAFFHASLMNVLAPLPLLALFALCITATCIFNKILEKHKTPRDLYLAAEVERLLTLIRTENREYAGEALRCVDQITDAALRHAKLTEVVPLFDQHIDADMQGAWYLVQALTHETIRTQQLEKMKPAYEQYLKNNYSKAEKSVAHTAAMQILIYQPVGANDLNLVDEIEEILPYNWFSWSNQTIHPLDIACGINGIPGIQSPLLKAACLEKILGKMGSGVLYYDKVASIQSPEARGYYCQYQCALILAPSPQGSPPNESIIERIHELIVNADIEPALKNQLLGKIVESRCAYLIHHTKNMYLNADILIDRVENAARMSIQAMTGDKRVVEAQLSACLTDVRNQFMEFCLREATAKQDAYQAALIFRRAFPLLEKMPDQEGQLRNRLEAAAAEKNLRYGNLKDLSENSRYRIFQKQDQESWDMVLINASFGY